MTPPPVCFLKGTLIWTPSGETRIQDLRVNDVVVTSSGGATAIQWVWRRRFERQSGQEWIRKLSQFGWRGQLLDQTPRIAIYIYRHTTVCILMVF